jgi:hypothetical protein
MKEDKLPKKKRLEVEKKGLVFNRVSKIAKATGNLDFADSSKKKSIAESPRNKVPKKGKK